MSAVKGDSRITNYFPRFGHENAWAADLSFVLRVRITCVRHFINLKLSQLKPRVHERFFACAGDAIFSNFVASPARDENRKCSHPWTGDATAEKIAQKKSREIEWVEFLAISFLWFFSAVASPVQGWLHWRFSSRAGDATKFEKIASPARAKNRWCSRGFRAIWQNTNWKKLQI